MTDNTQIPQNESNDLADRMLLIDFNPEKEYLKNLIRMYNEILGWGE